MSEQLTIKDVCNFIWRVEEKYTLLDLKFGNLPVWQTLRVPLYYDLLIKLGIGDNPHDNISTSKMIDLKTIFSFLYSITFRNPLLNLKTSDYLMLEHARTNQHNGKNIDIYTSFLEQEWQDKNLSWRSISRRYQGVHLKENISQRYRFDVYVLFRLISRKLPFRFTPDERQIIQEVSAEIEKELGIKYDLSTWFTRYGKSLRSSRLFFKWLFGIWKIKCLYLVVGYDTDWAGAVLAANELGIPVKEIQHGTISRYHLGYSYPKRKKKLKYFPDKLLVWSDVWKKVIPFSPEVAKIEVRGFDWLAIRKHQYNYVKKEKAVLVISQGLLGNRIAEELLKSINRWDGWDIRYKLHPGEYSRWKEYPSLDILIKGYGVSILENCDLYQQMAECDVQIGVFSTAIYEGIEFGCKTYLLDLPGLEYMQDLIDIGAAEVLLPSTNNGV